MGGRNFCFVPGFFLTVILNSYISKPSMPVHKQACPPSHTPLHKQAAPPYTPTRRASHNAHTQAGLPRTHPRISKKQLPFTHLRAKSPYTPTYSTTFHKQVPRTRTPTARSSPAPPSFIHRRKYTPTSRQWVALGRDVRFKVGLVIDLGTCCDFRKSRRWKRRGWWWWKWWRWRSQRKRREYFNEEGKEEKDERRQVEHENE